MRKLLFLSLFSFFLLSCKSSPLDGLFFSSPEVIAVELQSKTDEVLQISWGLSEETSGVYVSYLEGETAPASCEANNRFGPFTESSTTISGLLPDTNYSFRVCIEGSSPSSKTFTVKTEPYCYQDRLTNTPYSNSGEVGIDGLTNETAFTICNADQLNAIGANSSNWSHYFKLESDIDISHLVGTSFNLIGSSATKFTGNFDGNNHTINGFTYLSGAVGDAGFFREIDAPATIENINFTNVSLSWQYNTAVLVGIFHDGTISNVHILSGSQKGMWSCVASIAGAVNGGLISNVSSQADVIFTDGYAGGIAGCVSGGTIEKASFTGNLTYFSATADYTGGLIGYLTGGIVKNSYVRTTLNAPSAGAWGVGGAVGYIDNSPTVENVYAIVDLNLSACCGNGDHGLLVGGLGTGIIINSFYSSDATCPTCGSVAGTTKTNLELKQESTFTGWDFTSIWNIDETISYPELK